MEKEMHRRLLLEKRQRMSQEEVRQKSKAIQNRLISSGIFHDAKRVMSYLSFQNEVQTNELHAFLLAQGKEILVPYTDDGNMIHPCVLHEDAKMTEGKFGVPLPKTLIFAEKKADIIIMPCVGVDRYGNRIGFGKGCYDRFLKSQSGKKVVLAYAFQLLERISACPHDIPADIVYCDNEIIQTKGYE